MNKEEFEILKAKLLLIEAKNPRNTKLKHKLNQQQNTINNLKNQISNLAQNQAYQSAPIIYQPQTPASSPATQNNRNKRNTTGIHNFFVALDEYLNNHKINPFITDLKNNDLDGIKDDYYNTKKQVINPAKEYDNDNSKFIKFPLRKDLYKLYKFLDEEFYNIWRAKQVSPLDYFIEADDLNNIIAKAKSKSSKLHKFFIWIDKNFDRLFTGTTFKKNFSNLMQEKDWIFLTNKFKSSTFGKTTTKDFSDNDLVPYGKNIEKSKYFKVYKALNQYCDNNDVNPGYMDYRQYLNGLKFYRSKVEHDEEGVLPFHFQDKLDAFRFKFRNLAKIGKFASSLQDFVDKYGPGKSNLVKI